MIRRSRSGGSARPAHRVGSEVEGEIAVGVGVAVWRPLALAGVFVAGEGLAGVVLDGGYGGVTFLVSYGVGMLGGQVSAEGGGVPALAVADE